MGYLWVYLTARPPLVRSCLVWDHVCFELKALAVDHLRRVAVCVGCMQQQTSHVGEASNGTVSSPSHPLIDYLLSLEEGGSLTPQVLNLLFAAVRS
jgi:hypothetical protein